jgi:hypothetical protein
MLMRVIFVAATAALLIAGPALAVPPVPRVEISDQPVSVVAQKEPIFLNYFVNFSQGELAERSFDLFTVPQGKRFVIEYASIRGTGGSCVTAVTFELIIAGVTPGLPLVHAESNSVGPSFGGAMVKVYAGPGDVIDVFVRRNSASCTSQSNAQLSGYLEDDL